MWLLQSPVIQSHVAPSHGPPARVRHPLFFPAKSLLLPKPRGKKKHSKTTWSSLLSFRTVWSFSPFQNRVVLFPTSEPRGSPLLLQNHMDLYLSTCFRTSWFSHLLQSRVVYSFFQSRMVSSPFTLEPRGLLFSPPKPCGPPPSMAAAPRFKSQCPSSFAAPFLTPPTVSYTCQHPSILPALLGCHSKSGQVWPHGVEPIISKLSHRPCNQGELLLRPSLWKSLPSPWLKAWPQLFNISMKPVKGYRYVK